MALAIIAAGSIEVNVTNDVANHGLNGLTNKALDDMRATDQVFLTASQGARGGYPVNSGPVFVAAIEDKHAGGFDFTISVVDPNGWNIQNLNVDYLVVGVRP